MNCEHQGEDSTTRHSDSPMIDCSNGSCRRRYLHYQTLPPHKPATAMWLLIIHHWAGWAGLSSDATWCWGWWPLLTADDAVLLSGVGCRCSLLVTLHAIMLSGQTSWNVHMVDENDDSNSPFVHKNPQNMKNSANYRSRGEEISVKLGRSDIHRKIEHPQMSKIQKNPTESHSLWV